MYDYLLELYSVSILLLHWFVLLLLHISIPALFIVVAEEVTFPYLPHR
jgi:hypothetical protein